MTRRTLDAAHCSVTTTDSRQEGRFVVAIEQGRRPQTPGVYPARRCAPGNSGHLGCLITVYPFAQMRERVTVISVYTQFMLTLSA